MQSTTAVKTETINYIVERENWLLIQYKDAQNGYLEHSVIHSNEITPGHTLDTVYIKDAATRIHKLANILYCGGSQEEVCGRFEQLKRQNYEKIRNVRDPSMMLELSQWLLVQYCPVRNANSVIYRVVPKFQTVSKGATTGNDYVTRLRLGDQDFEAVILKVSYSDEDLRRDLGTLVTNHAEFNLRIGYADLWKPFDLGTVGTNTLTENVGQIVHDARPSEEVFNTDILEMEQKMFEEARALDKAFQEVQRMRTQMERRLMELRRLRNLPHM